MRGVEILSKHGSSIDYYTNGVPAIKNATCGAGSKEHFVEYAVHLWSNKTSGLGTDRVFSFIASTDWHQKTLDATWVGRKGAIGRWVDCTIWPSTPVLPPLVPRILGS